LEKKSTKINRKFSLMTKEKMTAEEKKYEQATMVSWFHPKMLLQAGVKLVVASLFGNYADRREMQAALDQKHDEKESDGNCEVEYDYGEEKDFWFDFVGDIGDGFNSTYSVARTVAKPLVVTVGQEKERILEQGRLLILGGDQIYPTPSREGYDQKFRIPYESAFPLKDTDSKDTDPKKNDPKKNEPRTYDLFAIPGNHDWYDGLSNFLKVFCQQRKIGKWHTKQRRSYFAIRLPHKYWLWATDIQLNEDIDKPQLNYFAAIRSQMEEGDRVILVTAKPAWVYKELQAADKSYEILKFFVEAYITDCKEGPRFDVPVILTGDLHHYSHYESEPEKEQPRIHYITAGGGGAALHGTHDLPQELERVVAENKSEHAPLPNGATGKFRVKKIVQRKIVPTKETSKALLAGNLLFPLKNKYFGLIFLFVYLLIFWAVQSRSPYLESINSVGLAEWLEQTALVLPHTPTAALFGLFLLFVFGLFGDNLREPKNKLPKLYAAFYGFLIFAGVFIGAWVFSSLHDLTPGSDGLSYLWVTIEIAVLGYFLGGLLMGIYLFSANRIFHNHVEISSTALTVEDYKNFLRLHFDQQGKLTIYPIGIEKVTKKWRFTGMEQCVYRFEGVDPSYWLIDDPIVIEPITKQESGGDPPTNGRVSTPINMPDLPVGAD
jgi:hypothetical protein